MYAGAQINFLAAISFWLTLGFTVSASTQPIRVGVGLAPSSALVINRIGE